MKKARKHYTAEEKVAILRRARVTDRRIPADAGTAREPIDAVSALPAAIYTRARQPVKLGGQPDPADFI